MTTIEVPGQSSFLNDLGFSCSEETAKPTVDTGDINMRNLALIISNLQVSRPTNEPCATSKIAEIERMARKARAAMTLRYQLIQADMDAGVTYNPLATIRNRADNNFSQVKEFWTISNEEIIHDLAFRRGRARAAPQLQAQKCLASYCHQPERGSQFLISRLQEKHGATCPPPEPCRSSSYDSASFSDPSDFDMAFSGDEKATELTQSEYHHSMSDSNPHSAADTASPDMLNFTVSPSDKYLECANTEVQYIVSVLEAALRQHPSRPSPCAKRYCHIYTKKLQEDVIPKHLKYLAESEKAVADMQTTIDHNIVGPTERIKLDADRVIAEINTSLSLKLRDCANMMTELERCSGGECIKNLGYCALEWFVFLVLRTIWVGSCIWSLVMWIIGLVVSSSSGPTKDRASECIERIERDPSVQIKRVA